MGGGPMGTMGAMGAALSLSYIYISSLLLNLCIIVLCYVISFDFRDLPNHWGRAVECCSCSDYLWGSSLKLGTIQRRLAWPLGEDDTHKSKSVNSCCMGATLGTPEPPGTRAVECFIGMFTLISGNLIFNNLLNNS